MYTPELWVKYSTPVCISRLDLAPFSIQASNDIRPPTDTLIIFCLLFSIFNLFNSVYAICIVLEMALPNNLKHTRNLKSNFQITQKSFCDYNPAFFHLILSDLKAFLQITKQYFPTSLSVDAAFNVIEETLTEMPLE